MPYCGRCLNVGRAESGERHRNSARFNLENRRINTAVAPRSNTSPGLSLAFVHEDLPGRAPASSAVVTTAACFAMTMSRSIACTSASGSAQQSRTTTKR